MKVAFVRRIIYSSLLIGVRLKPNSAVRADLAVVLLRFSVFKLTDIHIGTYKFKVGVFLLPQLLRHPYRLPGCTAGADEVPSISS